MRPAGKVTNRTPGTYRRHASRRQVDTGVSIISSQTASVGEPNQPAASVGANQPGPRITAGYNSIHLVPGRLQLHLLPHCLGAAKRAAPAAAQPLPLPLAEAAGAVKRLPWESKSRPKMHGWVGGWGGWPAGQLAMRANLHGALQVAAWPVPPQHKPHCRSRYPAGWGRFNGSANQRLQPPHLPAAPGCRGWAPG